MPQPAKTEKKQDTRFRPGQSGNPKGRPKGSRNKLGEAFVAALYADFQEHGPAAIEKVREERPQDYLKVCVSILPKELNIKADPFEGMTDAELLERIGDIVGEVIVIPDAELVAH
jgi:hypothetical protein